MPSESTITDAEFVSPEQAKELLLELIPQALRNLRDAIMSGDLTATLSLLRGAGILLDTNVTIIRNVDEDEIPQMPMPQPWVKN